MEGPYYPVEPIPIRARLRELDGRRAQGRWAFDALMPIAYESRPPHIHLRVKLAGRTALTSQLYLDGQTEESGFLRWVPGLRGPRDRLTLRPVPGEAGREPSARFDFVLA
jgi:protocatechuate 3,4-dioxygenase beta subunit